MNARPDRCEANYCVWCDLKIADYVRQGLPEAVAVAQVALEAKHADKLAEQAANLRRIEAELRAEVK